ncbi:PAS domain-containing methyl-accepting chemotaxis protein [Enterococcus sp. RIT-PI-f]|uniref:PAS domain-containing methyl-accepting chemotaxis protein n=1 Tax=Enterococcus sp. RIT-PI-f TaxID=1690244 RepID=UPI0006B91F41|nr:PAS domain-containing methyl-accepting chemotaxis protein [Enterococcus sp. RIT-PI-f]KPG70335.1 chemotaxis protein [Enterococcus sp. RIT-PI-f]
MNFTLAGNQNDHLLKAIFKELAVIVFDTNKQVVFANEIMADVLGYSTEEIIGLPHKIFCEDAYANSQAYQDFWFQLLDTKKSFQDKIIRRNKQGETLILEGVYFPVLDENQEAIHVVKIAFDITQRETTLAVTVKKVQESAAVLNRLSDTGHQQVNLLSANLTQVNVLSDQSQQTTQNLETEIQEVTHVLQDINRIAQQTKLLSFNAAIETARIGEQAAGFRVVTDEMQKLAEQTKQLTQSIESALHAINAEAGLVLTSSEATKETLHASQQHLLDVLKSYNQLQETAGLLKDEARFLMKESELTS